RAALRAGREPVPRRVHEAVQPAARGRAGLSRHAVSGVPQEDQGHLRAAAAVLRRLRRRRQLRPPARTDTVVWGQAWGQTRGLTPAPTPAPTPYCTFSRV